MAHQLNPDNEMQEVEQATGEKTELHTIGENIDQIGGRVLQIPDFVELAAQGFSEGQLKDMLRLRRRYNETEENEITPEFKRLRFYRYLYKEGRMSDRKDAQLEAEVIGN